MCSNLLSITTPIYFFFHMVIFSVAASSSPVLYHPLDNIAVNCGSSGNSTAVDGRQWIGDIGSKYINSHGSKGKSISPTKNSKPSSLGAVPYMTARISHSEFAYVFQVSPGQKFIRLHFHPASYRGGFTRSKAFFTVKAGSYTLLSNFSASLTVDAMGEKSLAKEFCVRVEENQSLSLTFSPSHGGSSDDAYVFVNGIEIVSMPTGLYHTHGGDPGAHIVGKRHRFTIDENIALEKVHRLNIGGSSILPMEDTGMFRDWSEDSKYLLESSVQPVTTTIRIKYTGIPAYTAPQKVHQTSWTMVQDNKANTNSNFTWKLPVDLGFRYLLRFHFCELEYMIQQSGHMQFSIFVNEQVAEAKADLINWSGGNGVAMYRDYVMTMEGDRMEGKRDLHVVLAPYKNYNFESMEHIVATVKGLEVFKLSNPDNNLAGVNPVPLASSSTSTNQNPRKLALASSTNVVATCVVILLTTINIIVYQLHVFYERNMGNNILSLESEGLCRCFSFAEVLSASNNFDEGLVIGSGGFGKVYKAVIDGGATVVALKRLMSKSRQGADEFWTEIEMLSKLRHTHLVSLLGYCEEDHEMILVYEYMEHGTLADHLYKNNSKHDGNTSHLSWEQRLNICIGAARGLDYLHTGTQDGIIHRDVKTTNILLDENWIAKISDFGLCKMSTTSHSCSHVSTDVKGTFGYLDPEYFLTRRLTQKSDVYAFGVVLVEVLCGRPAVDLSLEEEQHSLAAWARRCIIEENIKCIIDPSLTDQISSECLKAFADIASKCLHNHPNGRPTMAYVVAGLGRASEQGRNSSTEENRFGGAEQIDENVQSDDSLSQGTSTSPSTLVQYGENTPQSKKRSTGWLTVMFQRINVLFGKGVDVPLRKRKDSNSNSGLLHCDSTPQLFRRFSITEIQTATNDFLDSRGIGDDGFSNLYKGWIDHGTLEVAIRHFPKLTSCANWDQIQAQSQLRHPNILSSIGCCDDEGHRMLVYDYMVNKSLQDHLYTMGDDPLPWKRRLEICIGAARGLQYLHSSQIIHHNIKPSKILLDANGVAKLLWVDSSVMRPTGITTRVCGTMGYLDPEYIYTFRLTEKSDVYSFGIVLIEVLCCRKPYDPSLAEGQRFLVRWFRNSVRRKTICQVIDKRRVGEISPECLREFVNIAWSCLLDRGTERPSMNDVVGRLEVALQLQQTWHDTDSDDPVYVPSLSSVPSAYNNVLDDIVFDIEGICH